MANITEECEENSLPYSDEEGSFHSGEEDDEELEDEPASKVDSVTRLLEQLKNSGAIRKVDKVTPPLSIPFSTSAGLSINSEGLTIKTEGISIKPIPPKIPKCKKCDITFSDTEELHTHLIEHVKLPFVVLERLLSDDEEDDDDDNVDDWSDEEIEQEAEIPTKTDNSDILKKLSGCISIGKSPAKETSVISSLPSGLKAIIKKVPLNLDTLSKEDDNPPSPIEKINTSGSLKLTIKQSSGKDNFQVVTSTSSEMNVKKEPVAPAIVTQAATVTEPTPTLPKNWDTVDTKEGILDSNLIKKEPMLPDIRELPPQIEELPSQTLPMPTTRIKDEPGIPPAPVPAAPMIPKPMIIPKKEPEPAVAIIEINGDDSDNDDIMFVDSTPPPDKKPTIGIVPTAQITELPSSASGFSSNQLNSSIYSNPSIRTPSTPISSGSTEKQHAFNWNAPSKPYDSSLNDKSTDSIFQSLLESHGKDSSSDIGASEYISLDTLGPKHTCDVCRLRFTDLKLLDNHRKATGHSNQVVAAGASNSNALIPAFGGNSSLMAMNNLLPVKQLAEVAGKLAGAGSGGFSHQQNIMVNIHSFPPQNVPPQMHGYAPQQMPGYQPGYRMPDPNQAFPYPQNNYPQYPPQPGSHLGYPNSQAPGYPQQYMQQQPPGYPNQYPPGQMPPTTMPNHMPGQPGQPGPMMGQPMGAMPGQMPGAIPTSLHDTTGKQSPNKAGVMGGIKIQNSQSPAPGQKLGQAPRIAPGAVRGQMRMPMRGRGAGRGGARPMLRPGAPGQMIRGNKPMIRTPIKRPADATSSPSGTPTKKRMDMLLPDRHDNEDCHVVSLQNKRDGPFIESIKGSQESLQLGSGITVTKTRVRPPTPPHQKDASSVANMLAQRGIKIFSKPKSPSPPPVSIPNLGSDICIKKKSVSSSLFHVPEETSSHTLKCDMCHMSYSSFSQLQEHKRQFHNNKSEMGLPVVDLSKQSNLIKLSNLGITNFIPLANREQSGGLFGIPIVSVHNALNGSLNTSLQSLGAGGILSLGPVKPLP